MSHYTRISTKLIDRDCLITALQEMHYPVEQGNGLSLFGYQGDVRPQTADIVIRRNHISAASNDIGFTWVGDHFDALVSEYDTRLLGKDFLSRLTRLYSYQKVKKEVERKGLTIVEEERSEDQSIRLVVREWV